MTAKNICHNFFFNTARGVESFCGRGFSVVEAVGDKMFSFSFNARVPDAPSVWGSKASAQAHADHVEPVRRIEIFTTPEAAKSARAA